MKEIIDQIKYSDLFLGKQRAALKTALDTRKFEIELYWKRATYFWAFIAATFAGYFAVLSSDNIDEYRGFTILIASIGFFFSLGWYFVNRGSKFWQSNWEEHVSHLEKSIQGPLYGSVKIPKDKFIKLTGAYPFSVSKVNQNLSIMMILFWFFTFLYSIFFSFYKINDIQGILNDIFAAIGFWVILISLVTLLILVAYILKIYSHSFLKDKVYEKSMKTNDDIFYLTKSEIMEKTITMGNDEFILYIRKNYECSLTNDQLGKKIWLWLDTKKLNARQVVEDQICLWNKNIDNKTGLGLPKTATQFEFDRMLLPELYGYLDELGNK